MKAQTLLEYFKPIFIGVAIGVICYAGYKDCHKRSVRSLLEDTDKPNELYQQMQQSKQNSSLSGLLTISSSLQATLHAKDKGSEYWFSGFINVVSPSGQPEKCYISFIVPVDKAEIYVSPADSTGVARVTPEQLLSTLKSHGIQ